MILKTVELFYKWLLSVITEIDQIIAPFYIKIPVIYWFLLIFWTILLTLYDGLIIKSLSSGLSYLYKFFRRDRPVATIRILSEWYYLFDKFLYLFSPHVISYSSPSDNVIDKSNIYSPIVFYRIIKSFFLCMISFSFGNIFLWGIILSYFNPVLYQKVASFLKNLTWVEFTSAVSQVDFKGIGSFLTFASFLLSITIILLFSTNSFKWKAMRKVKEDKYEKVIKHNEQLEGLLCDISYKSKLNIDTLNHMIPYLPNMFSELITQTDKYSLEKDSLKKLDNKGSHSNTKLDDLVSGYESFQEQINKINEILKDIQDSRLLYVFSKVNKSARYEILELGLFFRTSLDQTLIEGEGFKKAIEERKRKLSRLTKDFIQINEVLNGWLKKEEFIKEYNKNGSSFTFEQIVKFKERKLKDAMIEFKRFLHQRLEDAMHHHIILIEYLEISHYNTKFSLVKTILSLFGPK